MSVAVRTDGTDGHSNDEYSHDSHAENSETGSGNLIGSRSAGDHAATCRDPKSNSDPDSGRALRARAQQGHDDQRRHDGSHGDDNRMSPASSDSLRALITHRIRRRPSLDRRRDVWFDRCRWTRSQTTRGALREARRFRTMAAQAPCEGVVRLGEVREEEVRHRFDHWDQAVDVALCYGWIDGQAKSLDETHSLQRFTPRGKTSKWSKLNRERVARLMKAGRMQPAGLAEVERAKADGRWDAAYDSPANAKVPDDLAKALAKSAKAKKFFESLSRRTATRFSTDCRRRRNQRRGLDVSRNSSRC